MLVRADHLQELSEELDIDQPAAHMLQVPDIARPLLLLDLVAHDANVGGDLRPIPLPAQHLRYGAFDGLPKLRRPGDDPGAGEREMLPGPG